MVVVGSQGSGRIKPRTWKIRATLWRQFPPHPCPVPTWGGFTVLGWCSCAKHMELRDKKHRLTHLRERQAAFWMLLSYYDEALFGNTTMLQMYVFQLKPFIYRHTRKINFAFLQTSQEATLSRMAQAPSLWVYGWKYGTVGGVAAPTAPGGVHEDTGSCFLAFFPVPQTSVKNLVSKLEQITSPFLSHFH